MSFYQNWEINAEYSFSTNTEGILPLSVRFVKLVGITTYDMARIVYGDSIYAQWRRIFTHLPAGTVDNPEEYDWLFFKAANGEDICLANPWIEGASVTPVKFRQQQFTLTNTTDREIQQVKMFLDAINASYTTAQL